MKPFDLSLYLIADPTYCQPYSLIDVVAFAVENGVTMVQYRDKTANKIELMARARILRKFLFAKKVPFIINDYVDLAMSVSADGVHLGQKDSHVITARKCWQSNKIIGLSIENPDQIHTDPLKNVDYLGVGPIFATNSKPDAAPAMGIENLKICRNKTSLPMVAIGGITTENVSQILQAKVEGVAVLSAICSHPEPDKAAKKFAAIVKQGNNLKTT